MHQASPNSPMSPPGGERAQRRPAHKRRVRPVRLPRHGPEENFSAESRAAGQPSQLHRHRKITASSAKEFDHIPVIRTQKRFAGHFAGQAFNASNHFTGPVREPPRFTDVRPLANLRESAAALETGITRPAFRHGSAPGEGAPMPSNEEKELPIL